MEQDKLTDLLSQKPKDFLIVGIGASAGGIQALRDVFLHVNENSGMAYVVILHLSPSHDSKLAEVLQTTTTVPVVQVTERTHIAPNHIYVVPPNQHLVMEDGHIIPNINLYVEDRRAPVDIFFRTLATSHGPRAICVILSGTGADGSMGLKRIKEMGGVAYVQNPREAEFNEMPRSAIATELVDEVLPAAEIPTRILAYQKSIATVDIVIEPEDQPETQQKALREIFTLLRVRTGHDFSNYKRPTLLRRIERRINVQGLPDLPSYATLVQQSADEVHALLKDLLISVTNFFRDKKAFEALEKEAIPAILANKKEDDELRIWVAGCATGEEAYSIAMLVAENISGAVSAPKVQIFATDIDDAAISVAREGLYTLNDAADVSPERLSRFFTKEGNNFRIKKEIREMILFANHNILKDPPFSRIDLVSCRNVLIYLNSIAQERILETFHFAQKPGGFLFLGSSESVDGTSDLYSIVNRENHLYKAREVKHRNFPIPESVPSFKFQRNEQLLRKAEEQAERPQTRFSWGELHHKLLEQYGPPSVVVNEHYDILHMSEKAGGFFKLAGGEPSSNLLKIINPDLRLPLRSVLYQAIQRQAPLEAKNIAWENNGKQETINILVRPVTRDGDSAKGLILILFEKTEEQSTDETIALSASDPLTKQLEEELIEVKSQLRSSVEKYEYQSEELKASNEELQAMNEEMRSAAEELETSKEELQSINEELRTVNQELKIKIEEISASSNNLQNLINSANVGTLFLDRGFRTRLYTPAILDIFNLIPADNGRALSDITHRLKYDHLLEDTQLVLQKLTVVEREVSTTDDRVFMMRILPYRTAEDRINGVVITFFEITGRKETETKLEQSEQHLRMLIESAKDYAIFTLDPQRKITKWSYGAEMMMGYTEAEVMGKTGDIIFTAEDMADKAPEKEARNAEKNGRAENERWHVRKDGSRFWGSGSVSPLRNSDGSLLGYVKIMRDLTEKKEAEEALRISEQRFRTLADAIPQVVWTNDSEGKASYFNKRWYEYSGLTYEQSAGPGWMVIVHPDDAAVSIERWKKAYEEGAVFDTEYRLRQADGTYRWHIGRNVPLKDENGKIIEWFGSATDITEQKLFEEELTRQVAEQTLELQRSNEDLHQFAHVASHDLKEPIRKIQTFNNRLREEFSPTLPPKAQNYLEKIESAANRMIAMIEGVLKYSMLNNLPQQQTQVNLNNIINQMKTDLELLIKTKKAEIITEKLPTVTASEILMYQLFYNLLLNSLKFTKLNTSPVISIACSQITIEDQPYHKIIFSDNGIGFDSKYATDIFNTFTRLNPTDQYDGTGLGLALCKKIVTRYGGTITAKSKQNEGTTFTILLPINAKP